MQPSYMFCVDRQSVNKRVGIWPSVWNRLRHPACGFGGRGEACRMARCLDTRRTRLNMNAANVKGHKRRQILDGKGTRRPKNTLNSARDQRIE